MIERDAAPGSPGDEPGHESEVPGDAREAALMRDVLRGQEKHREGGIDPELDGADADPEPSG